ncbi:MAG TPA: mechanosensitive ion channel domain-containing protein [Longimicrobiales bacterium]|nr:mechanosensitive ion channel domain-containing protein [Longimicrobiales bacterium]
MPRRTADQPAGRARPGRRSPSRGRRAPRPRTLRGVRRRPSRYSAGRLRQGAQRRLKRFRQGTALTVAVTGLALLLLGGEGAAQEGPGQDAPVDTLLVQQPEGDTLGVDTAAADTAPADPGRAVSEATGTLRRLAEDAYGILPKVLIALVLLVLAALLARLARGALRRLLGQWERADATAAIVAVGIWLVALGTALSVILGDPRALVGSVGLFGLALSWALQAPIESFTGWLMNSFRGYYRIGDRIGVGEVFGDVAQIDFLTTTVWEAGGPDKPVQGAQATGALITFPNSEVLRANIVNYTRDFPYVWDELLVGIANESDLRASMELIRAVADRVVGESMEEAATSYASLLQRAGLAYEVATRPEVYASAADEWMNVTVRYLVPARQRRRWSSNLFMAITEMMAEHPETIIGAVPRRLVQNLPPPGWVDAREGT